MTQAQDSSSIFARFGAKYGVDGSKVSTLLKATAFKTKDGVVTDEQMAALLIVSEQFGLNPFLKEIYAFPDKNNGIVPVIGVDGWNRIANEHPKFDGCEFRYAETIVNMDDDAKPCPEWVECVVYRKDRTRPVVVREYLEECYRAAFTGRGQNGSYKVAGPWQSHTKRFMRHKAFVQGVRMAFGFCGVYDDDEAERIANARVIEGTSSMSASIDVLPAQPPLALPVGVQFDELVLNLGFGDKRELVEKYVDVCAAHFKMEREQVMTQVLQRPDEFSKTFPAWARSATPAKAPEPPVTTAPTRARSTAKPKETVNAETGEVLNAAPQNGDAQEIQADKPPVDNSNKVTCPKKNGNLVEEWECAGCSSRKGCPSWDE